MEFNKINNLLGDPMLRSDLCDYSEAYVWVNEDVTSTDPTPNIIFNDYFAFKNNAPFISCVSKFNGKLVENAEDLDVVMPMYNLLEYSKNYQKTSGSLFNYYRDEPNHGYFGDGDNQINISIDDDSKSFTYKTSLNNPLPLPPTADGKQIAADIQLTIPLKHLGNFWRNLDIALINCEISIELSWTDKSVLVRKAYREAKAATATAAAVNKIESPTDATFKITDCKLYVPVVTLSTENENKLFEMLKSGFKRTVKWNKYMSYISNQAKINNLNYLIDPTFEKVNRLFVLSFENEDDRRSYYKYYVPNIEIKNYNVLIDGNPFFELQVKNIEETYEKILQVSDDNSYFTRGNLFDFSYFKKHYKMIAIDLSKRIALENKDTRQQINFIDSLERDGGATMSFIIEKQEETVIEFSLNYASIV